MSKSISGLTNRQSAYLDAIMRAEQPRADIEREMRLRQCTLRGWMTQEHFKQQWELCNAFLQLSAESETHLATIRTARAQVAAATPNQTAVPSADDAPGGMGKPACPCLPPGEKTTGNGVPLPMPPDEAEAELPPTTERERLRELFGEESALAFDDLVAYRHTREAEVAGPARPSPDSSPPPPDTPVVATPAEGVSS